MSRDLAAATATAVAATDVRVITFAKLDFASGIVYLHNSIGTHTWGGQDWLGVGDLGQISSVEEGTSVSPYKITLNLSGLDSTISSAALTEDYFMRPVDIYVGALNTSDVLVADPTLLWSGFMDVMSVSVGAESDVIQLTAESELAKFDRSRNLLYTNAQLQSNYSGDLFFEFLQDIEGAKPKWRDTSGGGSAGVPASTPPDDEQTPLPFIG